MAKVMIEKELLMRLTDAARYAAWYLKEYDESHIHHMATMDGFIVEDGECGNKDCVLCGMKKAVEEADKYLEGRSCPIQVREAQLPLFGTETPMFIVPYRI
jgi:hypothetical protein